MNCGMEILLVTRSGYGISELMMESEKERSGQERERCMQTNIEDDVDEEGGLDSYQGYGKRIRKRREKRLI